jgi:DNA-binding NtrC family response regulator
MPEPDEDEDVVDDDVPLASASPVSQDGRRLADVAREAALAAERVAIADTLKQVHWNRRKAAQLLGVSYKTLLNKIKETGIERP